MVQPKYLCSDLSQIQKQEGKSEFWKEKDFICLSSQIICAQKCFCFILILRWPNLSVNFLGFVQTFKALTSNELQEEIHWHKHHVIRLKL